jgi:adenosylcobinamide-phosphate synthase
MLPSRFLAAYAIDWVAGDPPGMPHPVRLIGAAISHGERLLRRPATPAIEILEGSLLTAAIVSGAWAVARVIRKSGGAGEVLLAWTTLATRSLLDESDAVLRALEVDGLPANDLAKARRLVARIVGRDTDSLARSEILRAVIETLAEGLCDGIVAPLMYLALGGVPAALAYKAVNTLDSMIGHREPPYLYFGRVPARLDDAANFVPARLAALAVCAAAFLTQQDSRRAWRTFLRDGRRHPSPNAGQPEAAMAGALGVRLGGMNYYGGEPSPKPVLYPEGRPPTVRDARRALNITAVASLVAFTLAWVCLKVTCLNAARRR